MEFVMCPIGVIHSPFTERRQTPHQSSCSQTVGQVEVQPEFVEGLRDIEGFSHIILLYVFHCASGYALRVQSPLDRKLHGLFATRHPYRPNAIGLSVVRLLHRHATILEVEGIDVLDGTPLLDIKPYVPGFDAHLDEVRTGWYAGQTVQS